MDIINKIIYLIEQKGIEQQEFARAVGLTKQTISDWKAGRSQSYMKYIDKIAAFFGVSVDYLLGKEKSHSDQISEWIEKHGIPAGTMVELPVLGSVKAGPDGVALEELIGYEPVQADSLTRGETYFWLKVRGDSMSPKIEDGDLVLIRKQPSVDSGSLAVVIVNGEEATIKKVVYGPDWIELHSYNPYYPVRRFEGPEVLEVWVLGLAIEIKRKL